MTQSNRTFRVFISSTFRDMHAERDHLVRFVFPELKERCRKLHVNLVDVDLRWGVTEKDSQEGRALDICLDEIDTCRPYFLGLLGQRYGFVPEGQQYSITAQEIHHGVLHNDLPRQLIDLRSIIEGKLEGKSLSREQINILVKNYQWDEEKRRYLLRSDVTPEHADIMRSIFRQYSTYQRDRSFFFFRKESLTHKLAGVNLKDFIEDKGGERAKLEALKREIIDAGLPYFEYDNIEAFGLLVQDTLWSRIKAEIERAPEQEKDWLTDEMELHELFMADRTRRFVGRQDLLDRMHAFAQKDGEDSLLVITGEPGCGKSALMARFSEEVFLKHPDWLILPHFVGASPDSTGLGRMLRRFCTHLNRAIGFPEDVAEDLKELLKTFSEVLAKAAKQRKIMIILDAVNQLETTDDAHSMQWLPQELPKNVRVVISTLAGKACDALLNRGTKPIEETIRGLTPSEIEDLVRGYLKEIRREFPNKETEMVFFDKIKKGNPLYIMVALEELRVFGKFEELPRRVAELPDNISALFDQVLQRIENDFNPALIRDLMVYLASGRYGMTAEEMQTLLKEHAPQLDATTVPQRFPDMIWSRMCRAFGPYLFERSGVIDFFHSQLKEAVGRRYLSQESARDLAHKTIADYFETRWPEPYVRALAELPYHLANSNQLVHLDDLLSSILFLDKRCRFCDVYKIIEDYGYLDSSGYVASENSKKFKEFIRRHANRLIRFREILFSLIYNEGFEAAKEQAKDLIKKHAWHSSWFKMENLQLPELSHTESERLYGVTIMSKIEFEGPGYACVAQVAPVAYFISGLGKVGMVDLNSGRKVMEIITIGKVRILRLTCNAEGRFIAIAYENGLMDIFSIHLNSGGMFAGYSRVGSFRYLRPEYEIPCMAFIDNILWYQDESGSISTIAMSSAAASTLDLTDIVLGPYAELGVLVQCGEYIALTIRNRNDTRLIVLKENRYSSSRALPHVDATAICQCGDGRIALALTNMKIVVYDLLKQIDEIASLEINEIVNAVCCVGETLLLVTHLGNIYSWDFKIKQLPVKFALEDKSIYKAVSLLPRQEDIFTLASALSILTVKFTKAESRSPVKVEEVFASKKGAGYLSILRNGDSHWLVKGSNAEGIRIKDAMNGFFDYNYNNDVMFARLKNGTCILIEPDSKKYREIRGLTGDTCSVCPDPQNGFWIADTSGAIYYLDKNGRHEKTADAAAQPAGTSHVHCWPAEPNILTWSAVCHYGLWGNEILQLIVFFRIVSYSNRKKLEKIGERAFAPQNGIQEICSYLPRKGEFLIKFTNMFRRGSVDDFINNREQEWTARGVDKDCFLATLAPDETGLYLLSNFGNLFLIEGDKGKLLGVYSGSVPINKMAGKIMDKSLMIIESSRRILACSYQEERT